METEVCMYADKMEVISPGALQNSMTIEKMIAGQRQARNPIIVEVLRDYGYVDARGMGIRAKVIPLMKVAGQETVFEATDDYVKTIFLQIKGQIKGHLSKQNAPLNKLQTDILKYIKKNKYISYDDIAELSDMHKTTVRRNIQKLKAAGFIERIGSKKAGYWKVL
jgi:ATP-dependent DNA helicase RecG